MAPFFSFHILAAPAGRRCGNLRARSSYGAWFHPVSFFGSFCALVIILPAADFLKIPARKEDENPSAPYFGLPHSSATPRLWQIKGIHCA
jgi:hypothetical protein